jgi:hypothetical protein
MLEKLVVCPKNFFQPLKWYTDRKFFGDGGGSSEKIISGKFFTIVKWISSVNLGIYTPPIAEPSVRPWFSHTIIIRGDVFSHTIIIRGDVFSHTIIIRGGGRINHKSFSWHGQIRQSQKNPEPSKVNYVLIATYQLIIIQ